MAGTTPNPDRVEIVSDHFDWTRFSPGNKVEVSVAGGPIKKVDRGSIVGAGVGISGDDIKERLAHGSVNVDGQKVEFLYINSKGTTGAMEAGGNAAFEGATFGAGNSMAAWMGTSWLAKGTGTTPKDINGKELTQRQYEKVLDYVSRSQAAERPILTKAAKIGGEIVSSTLITAGALATGGAIVAGVARVAGTGAALVEGGGAVIEGGTALDAAAGTGGRAAARLVGHETADASAEESFAQDAARAGRGPGTGKDLAKVEEGKPPVPHEEGMPELKLESNAGRVANMSRGTAALTLAAGAGIGLYELNKNGRLSSLMGIKNAQAKTSTAGHGHGGSSANPNAGDRPGSASPDDLNAASLDAARQTRGVASDGNLDKLANSGGEGPDAARNIRHAYGLDAPARGQPQQGQPGQRGPLQQQQQLQYMASQSNNVPPGTMGAAGVHQVPVVKIRDMGPKNQVHVWAKATPGSWNSPG